MAVAADHHMIVQRDVAHFQCRAHVGSHADISVARRCVAEGRKWTKISAVAPETAYVFLRHRGGCIVRPMEELSDTARIVYWPVNQFFDRYFIGLLVGVIAAAVLGTLGWAAKDTFRALATGGMSDWRRGLRREALRRTITYVRDDWMRDLYKQSVTSHFQRCVLWMLLAILLSTLFAFEVPVRAIVFIKILIAVILGIAAIHASNYVIIAGLNGIGDRIRVRRHARQQDKRKRPCTDP